MNLELICDIEFTRLAPSQFSKRIPPVAIDCCPAARSLQDRTFLLNPHVKAES